MATVKITKELITSVANQDKDQFVDDTNEKVNSLLSSAIDSLSKKVSYISLENVILQPINELLNGAFVDNSSFSYILAINNPQLELNTYKKINFWRNFKERFKYAWKNRKKNKKKRFRFKRKRKQEEVKEVRFDPTRYNIYDMAEDLQNSLLPFLSETTLVNLQDNVIRIYGKEDFGVNTAIVLYLANYNTANVFKYYRGRKKGFIDINLENRISNLRKKMKATGKNFTKILKIFNTIFYNINNFMPNQIYIESVLCFCPNELFKGKDIYKIFMKLINYITIKGVRNIPSINDETKTIYNDEVCGNTGIAFAKMLAIFS